MRRGGRRDIRVGAAVLVILSGVIACGDAGQRERPPPLREEAPPESPEPATPAIALTVDDLPWVGPLPPGWSRLDATEAILEVLEEQEVPAAGFVNCGRSDPGAPVLRRWMAAGHVLGNHTASHLDLNEADPAAWAEDARACDAFLRRLTGDQHLVFRYPYLHRGSTPERYRLGRETLEALGSVVAPVSVNTGDWVLDDAYVAALRAEGRARADTIAEIYLDHVVRATRHYREVAAERLDRDVRHVLLLHANALLAHHLDRLLVRLREEGFRFISLDSALSDPVYALEDDYVGPEGLSWLYRIAPATPGAQAWDEEEIQALRRALR